MANNLFQAFIGGLIIMLLISLSDPFMVVMPTPMLMPALLLATVLVCVFAGFVLRERTGDERETLHRLAAGRVAYLAGLFVLTIGLIVEGLGHHVDFWLAIGLGTMIIAKLGARVYSDLYK